MTNPLLYDRLRSTLRELVQTCAARAQREGGIEDEYLQHKQAAEQEFLQAEGRIQNTMATTQANAVKEFQDKKQAINDKYEEEHSDASREYSALRLKIDETATQESNDIENEYKEAAWTIAAVFEADKKVAKDAQVKVQRLVGTAQQRLEQRHDNALDALQPWSLAKAVNQLELTARPLKEGRDPIVVLKECVRGVESKIREMEQLRLPKLLKGPRLLILFAILWLLLQIPALWMNEWYLWVGISLPAIASIGLVLRYLLVLALRTRLMQLYTPIKQALADFVPLKDLALADAEKLYQEQMENARSRQTKAILAAEQTKRSSLQRIQETQTTGQRDCKNKYEPLLEKLTQQRDKDLKTCEARYQKVMNLSTQRYETETQEATEKRDKLLTAARQQFETGWREMRQKWHKGCTGARAAIAELVKEWQQLFPPWDAPIWQNRPAAKAVPRGLPFGSLSFRMDLLPEGIPEHEQLHSVMPEPTLLPALLPFPDRGSLILKASDEGRAQAMQLLQAVMMRALTALPPGKVRFTIIDPVGLGENFAAFAHLADYDEAMVNSRIWTEPTHIEQRLTDLTEHIENVIQKYLRNQFDSLEAYNAQAGEVAEPYRCLVIANFPANFTEEATRRLVSIAGSGVRCGIQLLIAVDTKQPLPTQFDIRELEQHATMLLWKDKRFQWQDPDFARFPLELEAPPPAEQCTQILQVVGERARNAGRVEVPFSYVMPPTEQWWKTDSRYGLRVALGRAGATKKQFMTLGQGTSQHVLIAGKTGSGKSTLLHALIVQLALSYSPEEAELYLIDFKKGVEFKTYAAFELPHARVIAIESEREFGLSVLQRLDVELRQRGDLFRSVGAHDLASFRATQKTTMPRVLLIVDEFQEFFVEDDKIAQETSLLMDRLVRQGRAFGIHILLGSQTLGGAYSLARSTIDQMAVRVALQCSETDGHLILSKDNSAARLLSRPGEAIYNDANGLVEGNNLFQVVWISDERKEECLREVQTLAKQRNGHYPPPIVFEGNAPSQLHRNSQLAQLLTAPAWSAAPTSYTAWLGESISIKEATAAVFRRISGANVLMVGQQAEAALGVLNAALLSLAAGIAPSTGVRFVVLGDTTQDDPSIAVHRQTAAALPHKVEVLGWRELPEAIRDVAREVDRRLQERVADAPPIFVLIDGIQRFRDLRKQEDDFSYSRKQDGQAAHPSKSFATIFREGPAVGVFTMLWCDTYNNLQRTLDRQALREFEMRVLFQMNAGDSSSLIDAPTAAKLGPHRGLLYVEDQGRTEKFRPYGLPDADWLANVRKQLQRPSPSPQAQPAGSIAS